MEIYLSAQWSRRDEMAANAKLLRIDGHGVWSQWHDILMGDDAAAPNEHDWATWAKSDLADIARCDAFVAFTEPPGTMARGGRHVEWGYAIGAGLRPIVVGPIESQFYSLRVHQFVDFEQFRRWAR